MKVLTEAEVYLVLPVDLQHEMNQVHFLLFILRHTYIQFRLYGQSVFSNGSHKFHNFFIVLADFV